MKLLLVAATAAEITPLTHYLQQHAHTSDNLIYTLGQKTVTVCITGVGMVSTTYAVTKALAAGSYTLAMQAGVGGSFSTDIPLGTVVRVADERYGDLGAEDHDAYIDIFDMGLLPRDEHPYTNGTLSATETTSFDALAAVSGITVNTVSGNANTIAERAARYASVVESMEGAAFHYVCLKEHVPFVQIRAISNYVEPRNRAAWKMKEAIINLNEWLIDFLNNA